MRRCIPWISLVALLVVFRLVAAGMELPNVSPLPAFLLCSLIFLRGKLQWILPAFAWLISNPLMNMYHGYAISWDEFSALLGMLSAIIIIPWVQRSTTVARTQIAAVVAALSFHFVTNTVSYFTMLDLYGRDWTGFWQAQWTGPIGGLPTWVFLRNLLASNMVFAALFMLAIPSLRLTLRPRTTLVEG